MMGPRSHVAHVLWFRPRARSPPTFDDRHECSTTNTFLLSTDRLWSRHMVPARYPIRAWLWTFLASFLLVMLSTPAAAQLCCSDGSAQADISTKVIDPGNPTDSQSSPESSFGHCSVSHCCQSLVAPRTTVAANFVAAASPPTCAGDFAGRTSAQRDGPDRPPQA